MRNLSFVSMAQEMLSIEQQIHNLLYKEKTRPDNYDFFLFEQLWGNTSGGFQGMGGSAMTTAWTQVLVPKPEIRSKTNKCFVFFGGTYAYSAPLSEAFLEDVKLSRVKGKYDAKAYTEDNN